MRKALESAGKDVEFVKLRGEDDYLPRPETRLENLHAIAKFIEEHLQGWRNIEPTSANVAPAPQVAFCL